MVDFDPSFIQPPEFRHKPQNTQNPIDEVPLIDLSADPKQLIWEISQASQNWGFFQIINHGVPYELRARIESTAREFFDQPMEEKQKVRRDEVHPMGYHDQEYTKNVKDWKEVFTFWLQDPTFLPASDELEDKELRRLSNQWPRYPVGFRKICEDYAKELEKLAFKLLGLISLSLGLPADRLNHHFQEQSSFIRFNLYPPCPYPELALGLGPHKDGGALTILAQDDVDGLQVLRKSDGEWVNVKAIPNAYIINIGDAFQVWSNDKYESVEHRVVVNATKGRFSIPFLFLPGQQTMLRPLDEIVNEQNPPRYREFNWGKFLATRNRSNYTKQNVENLQIFHFRAVE